MDRSTAASRAGLALLGLLSLGDIALLALTDGSSPPYEVAALAAVLGLASLVLVVRAWRHPERPVRLLVALRTLSALTATPAFFADDVAGPAVVSAAVIIVLTVIGVLLVARRPVPAVSA